MRRPGDAGAVKNQRLTLFIFHLLAAKHHLHAGAAEQAFPGDDLSIILFDNFTRNGEPYPWPGRRVSAAGTAVENGPALALQDPGPSSSTGMCRWLSVVWRTETSTNSRQYLQALSRTLPITSIKSFCSPTKVISGEMSSEILTPLR